MTTSQWILTPCGTSILTNNTPDDQRKIIFKYANAQSKNDIPANDLKIIQDIIEHRKQALLLMTEAEVSKASAELNALSKYLRSTPKLTTYHTLLPSDTWIGKQTAQIIQQWLETHTKTTQCDILSIAGLQTNDFDNFQLSLSDLSQQLIERTQNYQKSGAHIAFNLTGGFKAIAGFLQVLATCLADESFYIFERSEHLLRIPKLPLKFNSDETFRQNIQLFRRLDLELELQDEDVEHLKNIPKTLIFTHGDKTILSALGVLQWNTIKKDLYKEQVWKPHSPKIRITKEYREAVEALKDSTRIYEINKRMDELACYLEAPNKSTASNPKTLNFKDFKTKKGIFQIYAWSDRDARRIYGHFLDNGIFQIDSFEKHS